MKTTRKNSGKRICRAAAIAAFAATCMASSSVMAEIIDSGVINLNLPATFDGLYINLTTGATGITGSSTPGYDLDPYLANATGFSIFWCQTNCGGVAEATTGPLIVLAPGAVIGPSQTFSSAVSGAAPFRAGITGYVGVKFLNEETGSINFGYVLLSTSVPLGYPATLVRYAYDNTGAPITIPVPSPEIFGDGFEEPVIMIVR